MNDVGDSYFFDEELMTFPTGCEEEWELGVEFKAEHVGLLRQVKWFLKDLQGHNQKWANIVEFQGSNDKDTWET